MRPSQAGVGLSSPVVGDISRPGDPHQVVLVSALSAAIGLVVKSFVLRKDIGVQVVSGGAPHGIVGRYPQRVGDPLGLSGQEFRSHNAIAQVGVIQTQTPTVIPQRPTELGSNIRAAFGFHGRQCRAIALSQRTVEVDRGQSPLSSSRA